MSGPPHQADPVTLVVGSTGLLGHAVCQALRRRGVAVRSLVRSTGSLARPLPPGCEAVVGDLKVALTLAAACRGVTTVVTTGWDFARGRAQFVGSGRHPVSLISVEDVAEVAALAILQTRGPNRDLHLGGPDALSAIDALAIARRVTGRDFRVRTVPAGALRVMAILARPISPPMASLFRMLVAGAAGDAVDMAPVLRDFPIRQTTFEEYVRRSIV